MRRSMIAGLLVSTVIIAVPSPGFGQIIWTETSMIGYGGAGFGVGWLAAPSSGSLGAAFLTIGVASVGGMVLGARIGHGAEKAVRRGEMLEPDRLYGVRFGTVAGFAALGFLAGKYRITKTDGTQNDDRRTVNRFAILGAATGVVIEIAQEKWVATQMENRQARIIVGPAPCGEASIGVRLNLN